MFFDLASCPTGWSELTDAQGRALVGLPSGGTLKGTVGSPLADTEDRAHSHTVDIASTATAIDGVHSHGVNIAYHNMSVTPGLIVYNDWYAFGTSFSSGHSHQFDAPATSSSGATTADAMPYIQLLVCRKD
jgi:hypothetical protein